MEYPNAIAILKHEINWLNSDDRNGLDPEIKARWIEEFESAIEKLEE